MTIDYAAVVEDLQEKRAAAVTLFDGVIKGLQLLASPKPAEVPAPKLLAPPAKAKKPHRVAAKVHRPAATSHASKHGRRVRMLIGPEVKAIAERDGLRAASEASGIKYQTLWHRAKVHGWKVPNGNGKRRKATPAKPAAPKPKAKPVPIASPRNAPPASSELRKCHACERYTNADPCEVCHTPAKGRDTLDTHPQKAQDSRKKSTPGVKVPSYRCEACQLTTTRDPCEHCGTTRKSGR